MSGQVNLFSFGHVYVHVRVRVLLLFDSSFVASCRVRRPERNELDCEIKDVGSIDLCLSQILHGEEESVSFGCFYAYAGGGGGGGGGGAPKELSFATPLKGMIHE